MLFYNGSKEEIVGGYQLFDYTIDKETNKASISQIDNGNDASGIAIYCLSS